MRDKILIPKLEEISKGVREDIAVIAERFRGVGSPSIADKGATRSRLNRPRLSTRITPIPGTEPTFLINRAGFPNDQIVNIDNKPGLRAWVDRKIPGYEGNTIRIRGKNNRRGATPPLGAAERDMFGIAFDHLVGRDRTKYGLK